MNRLKLGIGLGLLTLAGIASACWFDNFTSVHFHSGQPDFGTLPRRAILTWVEPDVRPSRLYVGEGIPATAELDSPESDADEDWAEGRKANREHLLEKNVYGRAKTGQWRALRGQVREIAKRYEWTGDLRDMDMAFARMLALNPQQQTSVKPAFLAYLDAMNAMEQDNADAQARFATIDSLPNAGWVKEHAAYQHASIFWARKDYARARDGYRRFLAAFPQSPKREAALMMWARSAILPRKPEDRHLAAGKQALAQLIQEYPKTRYRKDIAGLRARMLFLDKQWKAAFNLYVQINALESAAIVTAKMPPLEREDANVRLTALYLHRLPSTRDAGIYAEAADELFRLRAESTVGQARKLARHLRSDPQLASDYLYYRLYHTKKSRSDTRQLAQFAEEVARLHPNARFAPEILTRFAETAYRDRAYRKAIVWANRSLQAQVTDRALYTRGASRHKLKQIGGATQDFEQILRRFPKSPLIAQVNENLALLYETVGRFDLALDRFFALKWVSHAKYGEDLYGYGYRGDIAYLLDCRMTANQVAAYLRTRPRHRERNLLHYSLGIRYLRDERWNEAEREFRSLPKKVYAEFSKGRKEWEDKPSPEPLVAVRELRKRHLNIAHARTDNTRAKALYEYASYYSTHGTLLLYNSALWQADREFCFDFWWNPRVVGKQDEQAVRRYMYQHEAYARSRAICKEIARRYPKAPIMPYVLFRQAAATNRLASFNQWWNKETGRAQLWADCIRTMRRIARDYPKHPVAVHARKYARVFAEERNELAWRSDPRQSREDWRDKNSDGDDIP